MPPQQLLYNILYNMQYTITLLKTFIRIFMLHETALYANTLIHCVYLSPDTISDDFAIEILDSLPLYHPQAQNTILCGDLNARIPSLTGNHASNTRGSKLQKWIESNSLFFWNKECAYGKPTFIRHNGSSIIDFFLSTSYCTNPKLQIRDDLSLGSDHKILNFSYSLQPSSATTTANLTPRRHLWRLSKLKNTLFYNKYKESMSNNLQPIKDDLQNYLTNLQETKTTSDPQHQTYIEHITTTLTDTLYSTMDSTIGATPGGQKRRDEFWNAELQRLVDLRERAYKKWKKAIGIDKLPQWLRHQEAAARVRRALNKCRKEMWRIFCDKLEKDDYSKTTATIKRIRQRRTIQPTYSHIDGPVAAANTMAQHLEKVYNGHLLNHQHSHPSHRLAVNKDYEFPITEECITTTIQNLPRKKAPGNDHIRSEMLKPIIEIIAPILHYLFHICWLTTYTPSSWRVAQVTPIYKKGAPDNPANFRPISLTSIFRKILEYCIKPEVETHSPKLDIAQGGFRPARSTLQQALCLQELSRIHKDQHGNFATLAFLDVTPAYYETVNREVIWEMIKSTMPPILSSFLKHLFNDVSIEVIISNATSHRFSLTTGVLQGSILSPFLYSLYINSLPSILRNKESLQHNNTQLSTAPRSIVTPLLNIDNTQTALLPSINCLLYADDVVLIGTPEKIKDLLLQCEEHSYQLGYRWNPAKSVIVEHPQSLSTTYQLYNSTIPKATFFIYLGIPVNYKGQLDGKQLIARNATSAEKAMRILSSIGISPTGVSKILSVRLYTQFIRPKLEYGLAITTPNKQQQ
ncbi:hypothetical protein INT45_002931 [Circinella minor]|uniref:Reverse transcriptase domain-containing protein n=1 Tax=Circinella minor TaxID=1195481 RepID=A0A8H7VMI1_9FUNG|nr:hypothetical protein INT45_002931 [Circinella minor]